jgi:hypothetical protein
VNPGGGCAKATLTKEAIMATLEVNMTKEDKKNEEVCTYSETFYTFWIAVRFLSLEERHITFYASEGCEAVLVNFISIVKSECSMCSRMNATLILGMNEVFAVPIQ